MLDDGGKLDYDRCRGLLARLLATMQDVFGADLLSVALFGSVARGEGGRTSDRIKTHPWLLLDVLDHGIILFDREGVLQNELERLKERLRSLGARKVALADGSWYWDLKPDWKPGEVVEL